MRAGMIRPEWQYPNNKSQQSCNLTASVLSSAKNGNSYSTISFSLLNIFCSQIPGYGRDTALPLLNPLNAAGQQNFHQQFPPGGNAHQIGAIPNPFNARLESYTHLDVLGMVVFYNDTFGIDPADDLAERLIFRRFLTEF